MITLWFLAITAYSQKYDYVWLMGYGSNTSSSIFGGTVIDFNTILPDIYYDFREMNFSQVNASICDTTGNLLFYTNGIYIANALGEPMENGLGLNPGPHAQSNQEYGYILDQGAIALPVPEQDSLYYLLHLDKETPDGQYDYHSQHFYYTLININENNGLGRVLEKNQVVIDEELQVGKLTAVKHANGRDWWILLRKYGSNLFNQFLVTPTGIFLQNVQQIGYPVAFPGVGQAVFSPDGNKYAFFESISLADGNYCSIYDFDRCSGQLSNPVQFTFIDSASCGGIAISPNSRFLYVSSCRELYQYDLWASDIEASRITVAEWDGFVEDNFFATTFYLAQLAPDGKIYINSNNTVSYLHVINQPDLPGLLCDVCQHCVDLSTKNLFSLPNFPNYRLHHLEGSPCDTLRQPPTAAWGYDAAALSVPFTDSSYHDIRAWYWDFGDGTADTIAHPTHTYAAEGMYQVCLSVSNPRGADTLCKWVQVLSTQISVPNEHTQITLSPNPAAEQIVLTAENLPGGPADLLVYDALGREVLRRYLQVHTDRVEEHVSISNLPTGVYFLSIQSGGMPLWQGKIVKR
ncbi:MAG: T9SS type A sorting domain-containing protein [Saprospiraceae bacterium]|nr:T9SS type A sorting domain-containing protein [Saprospiraceae bacterium]